MTEIEQDALVDLVDLLAHIIREFVDNNPDIPMDSVAAAVSYLQGSIFRLASEIPPSKLH